MDFHIAQIIDFMSIAPFPIVSGLTTRSEIEVAQAIQECAADCLDNGEAAARVRMFVAKLIAQGWTREDSDQVGIGALRVVAHITGDESLLID